MFAVSFVVWAGYSFLRRFRFKSWKPALLIGVACLALNFGQYARNFSLFGSPIYPRAQNFESIDRNINDVISPSSILSNITRNIGLHMGTPSWQVNYGINGTIEKFHQFLNIDINDPRTTDPTRKFQVPQPSRQLHEDYAGNLLHLSLILGAGFLFLISKESKLPRTYVRGFSQNANFVRPKSPFPSFPRKRESSLSAFRLALAHASLAGMTAQFTFRNPIHHPDSRPGIC
jgi:hypothetical protein